ncbi:MAG: metalloregulator ArsR/SmtB family transcription factor [Acidobacteria bacterium]|nr:metalloregulator ArsR/SmtB family transcription factor [Acidobacteriota bacterium]MCL5288049.1 metalloregulator ArsR/SmtB family transcription factor [Acidobacteriota bacterium]
MKKTVSKDIDEEIYERQVRICKAFANPIRLRILDLLSNGAQSGAALQGALGISTPNLSQHLAVLKAAGVVTTHRKGKQIHCSLTMPEVKQACQLIRDVLRAQIRNGQKLRV